MLECINELVDNTSGEEDSERITSTVFQHLKLQGKPFEAFMAAEDEDMERIWSCLRDVDPVQVCVQTVITETPIAALSHFLTIPAAANTIALAL